MGLSAVGLAASLALLGANASVGAPDDSLRETSPSAGSGSSAAPALARPGIPLPEGIDDAALRHRMIQENAAEPRVSADAIRVTEEESAGSEDNNDRVFGAERLHRPHARHGRGLRIDGTLTTETVEPEAIEPNEEDDGAIPLARSLELGDERHGIHTTGRIGDGPHGSPGNRTGDYDFHRLAASAGDTLTVDIAPDGELKPNTLLYDADGNLLIGAQDTTGTGKAHLSFPIERDGDYYVAVGNYFPTDAFDPGSGPGVISEGPYRLDVTLRTDRMADTDLYAIPLRKGDVLGATVTGSARRIAIHGSDGDLVQASAVDVGLIYPDDPPLPRGGNATANHVVEKTGLYFLAISDGSGDYSATVASHRAPSTTGGKPRQTIYLDFTGPTFDNRGFVGSAVKPGVRDLSPMRDFLPKWGLRKSNERAVIEATVERVQQILRDDIPGSKVRLTNSLDHPDMFGEPGVSRVIVGGTVEESGLLPSFGAAESIDPGNFAREETAIVMPGLMSAGKKRPSLNAYLTKDSGRIRAVAQALGNTAGHEAGHFLGNYHTDDYDEHTNVMNSGNRLQFFAVGPDGVAGTADDDRIAMRTSRYDPLQGLSGTESTRTRTQVALGSDGGIPSPR